MGKRELPAMAVVPIGPSGIHRAAAMLLADQQKIPVPSRRPDYHQSDGYYGLGTGPPGMGEAPPLMHQPGGDLLLGIEHPAFKTVERLYRVLPDIGFYSPSLSPRAPFAFELGAFSVPDQMQLWLTDYSFGVLRLSGIDPGDYVYAEDGRFSGQMGFDVTINRYRYSDLAFQLDPQPIPLNPPGFDRQATFEPFSGAVAAEPNQFTAAAFESFASTAGPGDSLLPVRQAVMGPRQGPFTIVVDQNQRVGLGCVVFRRLLSPIAAIEGRLAGFLIHTNLGSALLERVRPR